MNHLLLIEDDAGLRHLLALALRADGWAVTEANSAAAALSHLSRAAADVILLDLGLPDQDGQSLLPALTRQSEAIIVVLSARNERSEKLHALDQGADDFLTKPFRLPALLERLRAARAARRVRQETEQGVFRTGTLVLDLGHQECRVAGNSVSLTLEEFRLLWLLACHAGRLYSWRQLARQLGMAEDEATQGRLLFLIGRLRHRIEIDPGQPRYILSEPGIGVRLVLAPATDSEAACPLPDSTA